MRFRKKKEDEPRISIAPLVDIVFLLLIFFMVTSHYDIASGVRIKLPKVTKKAESPDDENKIVLLVDKSANIFIEGKKIDIESLKARLGEEVKKRGIIQLVLQADIDVRHGKVVEIMDYAKSAGINSIVIAARWRSKELL
ncbi:ExbD/TolR family protein [Thermodesulfobacteriota bacterium]